MRNKETDYQSATLLTLDGLAAKDLGHGRRAGLMAAWVQRLADDKGPLAALLLTTPTAGASPMRASIRLLPSSPGGPVRGPAQEKSAYNGTPHFV